MSHSYKFFPTSDYFTELNRSISKLGLGDRAYLATMAFDVRAPATRHLMQELGDAAARGADVRLIVDAMPFLLYAGRHLGPLYYGRRIEDERREPFAETYRVLETFRGRGGKYAIVNKPARPLKLPIGGRSHIKFAIINSEVMVGGCNLDSAYSPDIDIMVGWQDQHSSEWMRALAEQLMAAGHARRALHNDDVCLPLDAHSALLVDAGVPRQSLIMRRAMALIDEAQDHVFISCQFFPGQITGQRLLAAHRRGVRIVIVYGHPDQHDWFNQKLQRLANIAERWRLPEEFFAHVVQRENGRIHAKLIATEKGAILGSHNYVSAGVRLGTAEIALLTDDASFGRRATETVVKQLAEQGAGLLERLYEGSDASLHRFSR